MPDAGEDRWRDIELVPFAAVNQYSYCPRRCWYLYVGGEFVNNEHTLEGSFLHERVHSGGRERDGDTEIIRGVYLYSFRYGVLGVADVVEIASGYYRPVEYKKGRRDRWENDRCQLCAQALALEDVTGAPVEYGHLYYAASGRRLRVDFTAELRRQTLEIVAGVRALLVTGERPPAIISARCRGCSMYAVCLPREVAALCGQGRRNDGHSLRD